jgi:STE24 endopeptidase
VPIVLVILVGTVLLARGDAGGAVDARACAWTLVAGTLGPLVALAAIVRSARAGLGSGSATVASRAVARAERMRRLVPWIATAAVATATHAFGWLGAIRGAIGDVPALDELVAILPAVATMVAATWIHWPLEQRLRRLAWLDRIESGLPPWPEPGRTRATLAWVRGGGITIVLVPVVAILAASETAEGLVAPVAGPDAAALASLVASVATLLVSPLLLRYALGLGPLPPGPVRDEVSLACAAHRVRLAGAYVWPTGGLVANAAILGILPRLRYLLLSDLLLAALSREEILAVVEHELAHVKRRHLPWMALAVASIAVLAAVAADESLRAVGGGADAAVRLELAGGVLSGVAAFLGLGWISRRFERQADAFAAAELSRRAGSPVVEFAAVEATASALDRVAELAHVDPRRPSWRHGSIRWRQGNLKAIAGLPVDRLPIDRTVRRIKFATLVAAAVAAWLLVRMPAGSPADHSVHPKYDAVAFDEGTAACAS